MDESVLYKVLQLLFVDNTRGIPRIAFLLKLLYGMNGQLLCVVPPPVIDTYDKFSQNLTPSTCS